MDMMMLSPVSGGREIYFFSPPGTRLLRYHLLEYLLLVFPQYMLFTRRFVHVKFRMKRMRI